MSFLVLAGCGKPEITSECSLSGRGDVKCTFKNSGKSKGSSCEHIVLAPKKEGMIFFSSSQKLYEEAKKGTKKMGLVKIDSTNGIKAIFPFLINNEKFIVSHQEICSGIVEPGDIRESNSQVEFLSNMSPFQVCDGKIATIIGGTWADNCSFATISTEAVVAMINIELLRDRPIPAVVVTARDDNKSGEEVVKQVCSMCHATGLLNAPKVGDKVAWKPRIAQGYDTLVSHAINGIRSMPARGGNAALTDGEIANAVVNMANQAGANFTFPAPKSAVPADAKTSDATPAVTKAVVGVIAASKAKTVGVGEVTNTAPTAAAEKAAVPVIVADDAPVAVKAKSGQEVYKAVCSMCHGTGLMNAPKFADKEQWGPRIAQGHETLVNHALKGFRLMPAKGGNSRLSDDEVEGAVKYMANEAGAEF